MVNRIVSTPNDRRVLELPLARELELPAGTEVTVSDHADPMPTETLAYTALEEATIESEAMAETVEALSLNLGDYVRNKLRSSGTISAELNRSRRALRLLSGRRKADKNRDAGEGFSLAPEAILENLDLTAGEKLLAVEALLASSQLSAQSRGRLDEWSQEERQKSGWEVDVCNQLSFKQLDDSALKAVKYLYEKIQQQDMASGSPGNLMHWFEEVAHWSDRSDRVQVLMRALALDLSIHPAEGKELRLANNLSQLSKFWSFLSVESETESVDQLFNLPKDGSLRLLIESLEEAWLDANYFLDRAEELGVAQSRQALYFRALHEVFTLAPDSCFNDADQREQVEQIFQTLQENFEHSDPRSIATAV